MSASASQAAIFYRDVAANEVLWTVKDDDGFQAPKTSSGIRSMPFWSSESRAHRIIKTVPAYNCFKVEEVSWLEFATYWVRRLNSDGYLIGVNWSGKFATGYDLKPSSVKKRVDW